MTSPRRNDRACRVCRSPARRNPCWFWIDRPSFGKPALCEIEDEEAFAIAEAELRAEEAARLDAKARQLRVLAEAATARARRIEFVGLAFMASGAFVGLCVFWRYWT
jgi:hypothetical protein